MKCKYCEKDSRDWFLIIPYADHWCAKCGGHLCKDHRKSTHQYDMEDPGYKKPMDLCSECYNERESIVESIIAVKNNHVGGHKIVEEKYYLETGFEFENYDHAIWDLKFNAHLKGANAIINLKTIPHQHSDGNYIYKKWTAGGNLVNIEKYTS